MLEQYHNNRISEAVMGWHDSEIRYLLKSGLSRPYPVKRC